MFFATFHFDHKPNLSVKKGILLLSFLLIILFSSCTDSAKKEVTVETQYQIYCGSCHLAPDPANIPKAIWENDVLPEMGARMGYKYNNYNPLSGNSMEENVYIRFSNVYPNQSVIDSVAWKQIHDYILDLAPDSIPIVKGRSERNLALTQFKPTAVSLEEDKAPFITNIQFDPKTNQFTIGDVTGELNSWPKLLEEPIKFSSPIISNDQKEDGLYVTEIGIMNPSEKPLGVIHRVQSGSTDTIAKKLHRPVYTEIVDLNDDGIDEILVCEFGNLTGELSMLINSGSEYKKRTLLPLAGTIKLDVTDMNKDGKNDIVVLSSQGNEGIFILYQQEDLQFSMNHAISIGPEYGSSWFELMDYNADGHLDIVLANGDNADYSVFLKPYHGLRLFLNDGKNGFEEKWFYPIYGATRVLAEDYDLDGDLDFAVMAFFPDYDNSPDEGFVYLENMDSDQYQFQPYTLEGPPAGRWLVMEDGDFDQDRDMDIMLGTFILPMSNRYSAIIDNWRKEPVNLLLLENKVQD